MSNSPDAAMYTIVKVAVNGCSDEEVTAQLFAVQLEVDPRSRYGYAKLKALYTEQGGTRMHDLTRATFLRIATARLFPQEPEGGLE